MAESPAQPNPGDTSVTDSIVLEEEIDPNYVPSEDEVVEYAKWLGMDLEKDQDLFWVAREGLMAPLPKNWKPCKTKDTEDIYYFNFSSGESTWDHPCDGYYKSLYEEEKKKKEILMKEKNDQQRSKAKQDVGELLGKGEKKKRNSKIGGVGGMSNGTGNDLGPIGKGMAPLASLERKPLPGIQSIGTLSAKSQSLGGLSSTIKETNSPTNLDNSTRRRTRDITGMDNRLASSEPIMGSNRLHQSNDNSSGPSGRKSTNTMSSSATLSRVDEGVTSDTGSVSDADSEGTAVRGKPASGISRTREDDAQSFPASSSRVRDRDREREDPSSSGPDRGAESKTTSSSGFGKAQSKLTNRLKGALEPSLMNINASEEKDQERNSSGTIARSNHRSNISDVEDFKSMDFDDDANSDIDVQEELMRAKQLRESRGSLTSTSSMRRPTYVTDPVDDDEEESSSRRRSANRVSLNNKNRDDDDAEGISGKSSSRRASLTSDAKDVPSSNKTRGSSNGGENDEYYEAAREHREEMETRRRNWQEEVDFHEAAVKKRREAMLREQERLDEEQEALKKRRDSQTIDGSPSSSATNGPGASELRTKMRQLEMEIDEQKSKNERMKEQLNVAEKLVRREKENLEEARKEAADNEEGLLKQIQSSKLKTSSLKEERDSLELEVSRLRSEVKHDKGAASASASAGGEDVDGMRQKTLRIDELEETVENLNMKLTKEKQAKEALKEALEEQETKHEQALRTASSSTDAERRVKAIQESLDVTTQECNALKEKLETTQAVISQHDKEMEDRKEAADETIRQLNVALSDARNELDNLQSKNKRLETVAKSCQDDAAEKDSKYQQARSTLTALQSKHDVLESEVTTLRTKLVTETEDLVKRNAEIESQLSSLKKAKGHVESLLLASGDDSESGTVKGLMEQVTELTAAVEKEKALLADKDAQLIAQNARMETMEAAMADVNKQVLQATTAATHAIKEEASVEMNAVKADLSKLQVDLLEAVALKEQLQSEVIAMSTRVRTCAIGCASSICGLKSERQIIDAIEKSTFLESQNASLSDRVQSQASEAVSLRMKAEAAESKLVEGNSDLESWQRKLQEKSAELVTLRGKVQQMSMIEVDRDNLKRKVQSLEETISSLEATIKRVRTDAAAELSAHSNVSTGPSATELQTKLALDAANDQINSLTRKISTLEAEVAHLQQTNGSLVDRMKIQATETAEWHSKYQTGQEDIIALTLKLTASQTGNQTSQSRDTALVAAQQLLLTAENERDQLKRTVEALNESLRNKDTEMAKLRADAVIRAALPIAVTSDDVRASVTSTGGGVGNNGSGFTALSATVAEQQTSVRKLEEKLHAAEVLIVALSRTQEQMSSGAATAGGSSSSQSPRRQRKQSTAPTAFVGTRAAASSSSTTTGRTTSGVGVADSESDDRFEAGPAWDSSPELEEEKGHARAGGISGRMHTHDMRDLWSKVMSTREPLIPRETRMHHEKGSKSTTVPRGSSGDHLDVGIDSWTTKIEKEQLFVDNLSATLRDDKAAIRREQETLGKRRATWRARKKTLNPRDGVGRAELKAQSEELNAQTLRLNDAVEQTGAMHRWLVLRRKKLDTLQEYVRSLRAGSAYTKGEPGMENHPNHECKDKGEAGGGGGATSHHGSKGSSHHNANADITLDALERMGRDMDSEVEVTMMDLANHTSPLDSVTAESDLDNWLFQGSGPTRRSGGYSRGRSSQYEYHQQLLHEQQQHQPQPLQQPQPPSSFHPPPSQPYYQPQPHYAPAQYGPPPPQYHGPYGPSPRTERELFGTGYNNGNAAYGYYDNNYGQYPHPQPMNLPPGPPPAIYATDDAARWAVPAASVRFNLNTRGITSSSGGGSSAPSLPFSVYHEATATAKDRDRDPRAIREQLKEITNRRVQSSEAFDTHASWLNNLQQEIGRHSHESAALAIQSSSGRGGGRGGSSANIAPKTNKFQYGSSSASSVHSVSTQVGSGTETETVQI